MTDTENNVEILGEVWFWQIRKLRQLQTDNDFAWWQLGYCSWGEVSNGQAPHIKIIKFKPLRWRWTLKHEDGHARIARNFYEPKEDYSSLPKWVQDEYAKPACQRLPLKTIQDMYDRWNWHGVLLWRH